MRTKMPFLSVMSQTLSALEAMPPSESAGPTRNIPVILFVEPFTRATAGDFPHSGTHRLPKLYVSPEHGGAGNLIVATNLFVSGLIRWTEFSFELETQIAFSVTAIQSGLPPNSIVAEGFSVVSGT